MMHFNYQRRQSSLVHIGRLTMGQNRPIRIQSMANTDTNDIAACIAQAQRIIDAGGELVRFTAQGTREAEHLKDIRAGLRVARVPLVADIHFQPEAADVAAQYVEKVRINPGNYVDKARKFEHIEYTDQEYAEELERIKQRLVPFLHICQKHHTAIRIGVNHGSLSDRIMSRYGDTPHGMVESCMEFLRICVSENFTDVVISIKSSNTAVMVQTVRLLVETMDTEDMHFPLHLGVTEAGDGEDGRIKSAVGIGALLADGLGDTIRVSLSEDPEKEIPVARELVNYFALRHKHPHIKGEVYEPALQPGFRRSTIAVGNIGGEQVPVVFGRHTDTGTLQPDYEIANEKISFGGKTYPLTSISELSQIGNNDLVFVQCPAAQVGTYLETLKLHSKAVLILLSEHINLVGEVRAAVHQLLLAGCATPVVVRRGYDDAAMGSMQLKAAADMGVLLLDGLINGLWLDIHAALPPQTETITAFAILQAARRRTSKTEYISCPSCGRTLFDLQKTVARVKAATAGQSHLKIGIMGCIVNGPGEMADADYGYVGAARNCISLYKGKTCIEKNIPENEAVEKLIALIKANGDWKEAK